MRFLNICDEIGTVNPTGVERKLEGFWSWRLRMYEGVEAVARIAGFDLKEAEVPGYQGGAWVVWGCSKSEGVELCS